jgi:hypothetical protein
MTKKLIVPIVWGLLLLGIAILLEYVLSPRISTVLRFFNGFCIITLLAVLVAKYRVENERKRVLDAEMLRELREVTALVTNSTNRRNIDLDNIQRSIEQKAAETAKLLDDETRKRIEKQTLRLENKIETGTKEVIDLNQRILDVLPPKDPK